MALLETKTAEQARRLELDGFNRVGKTAVETGFQNLEKLLNREDIKTDKIVVARKNGDKEEELVNDFIRRELEGKYRQIWKWRAKNWGKSKPTPRKTVAFSADEHQIRIKTGFKKILNGELPDRERIKRDKYTFEKGKQKHIKYWKEELEEAEEKEEIEEAREKLKEGKELEKSDQTSLIGE